MTKYIKYIVLVILALICVAIVWTVFLKENKQLTEYKQKFSEETQVIIEDNGEENPTDSTNAEGTEIAEKPEENPESIIDETTVKPVDRGDVIITSETEMLNKKGQDLLKEISKELDETFKTISGTPGIVDTDKLQESLEEKE